MCRDFDTVCRDFETVCRDFDIFVGIMKLLRNCRDYDCRDFDCRDSDIDPLSKIEPFEPFG